MAVIAEPPCEVTETANCRIMSLLMLSATGLVPISQALSGAIVAWNLSALFVLAGGLIVLVTVWVAFQPSLGIFSNDVLASA